MFTCGRAAVLRGRPPHRIAKQLLDLGVVVGWRRLVPGAEVEHPSQATAPAAAATKDLAALEPADEHVLVRGGHVEGFAVHLLAPQFDARVETARDRVLRVDRPHPLTFAVVAVEQPAARSHQAEEQGRSHAGVQEHDTHAAQYPIVQPLGDRRLDKMVSLVRPVEIAVAQFDRRSAPSEVLVHAASRHRVEASHGILKRLGIDAGPHGQFGQRGPLQQVA